MGRWGCARWCCDPRFPQGKGQVERRSATWRPSFLPLRLRLTWRSAGPGRRLDHRGGRPPQSPARRQGRRRAGRRATVLRRLPEPLAGRRPPARRSGQPRRVRAGGRRRLLGAAPAGRSPSGVRLSLTQVTVSCEGAEVARPSRSWVPPTWCSPRLMPASCAWPARPRRLPQRDLRGGHGRPWPLRPAGRGGIVTAASELAYLARALKAPRIRRRPPAGRTPAPKAGTTSATWPRCLRRRCWPGDLGGATRVKAARLPAGQDPGRLRLHLPALGPQAADRPPRPSSTSCWRPTTSCSSARPGPARPTSASPWRCRPPAAATGSPSPPPTSGSTASTPPSGPGGSTRSWSGCGASRCWSVDEVGYIPFDPEAAALFFALVSSATSGLMIVNSNKTFQRLGRDLRRPVAVAAMVDRLVHHAEIVSLKGDSR